VSLGSANTSCAPNPAGPELALRFAKKLPCTAVLNELAPDDQTLRLAVGVDLRDLGHPPGRPGLQVSIAVDDGR